MDEIIKYGNSSHINSAKYKIFTSAIVGGIIPIALGVAMGIKLNRKEIRKEGVVSPCPPHVYVFVGDMASEMGCFGEAMKYAHGEKLPITFIIEDNELGCNTPTREVWKANGCSIMEEGRNYEGIIYYKYKRYYPHYGIGEFVTFKKGNIKSKGDYQAYKSK
jgi:pyruvate dehydrogenase E1 component alpha subunit